jgi:hypothetical protein
MEVLQECGKANVNITSLKCRSCDHKANYLNDNWQKIMSVAAPTQTPEISSG